VAHPLRKGGGLLGDPDPWCLIAVTGLSAATAGLVHSMALEYLPFILMLFALYTAREGFPLKDSCMVTAGQHGHPRAWRSDREHHRTTGASMILIRPLIRANSARGFNTHVVVFFIFLVSNIGGALTPLAIRRSSLASSKGSISSGPCAPCGQRSLYGCCLAVIFFLVDSYFYWREKRALPVIAGASKLRVSGFVNAGPHWFRDPRHRRKRRLASRHRL